MIEISQTTPYTPAIAFDSDLLKEQMSNLSNAPESKASLVPSAEQDHHLFVRKTSQR